MALYKNGVDLNQKLIEFVSSSNNICIYVPYVKLEPLRLLIDSVRTVKIIVVRWERKDLIQGFSDLEIYPYLKEKGICLYRNPRIHLKAFVDDYRRCMLGSANITSRAINLPKANHYNYELATIVDNLNIEDRLYFDMIVKESMLITEAVYLQIKEQLSENQKDILSGDDFILAENTFEKSFLVSALPMTYSVNLLYNRYIGTCSSELDLNCCVHDLALYKVPLGLSYAEFRRCITKTFFAHPFIARFLEYLDSKGEVYFGEAKEWIQRNCTDVPTPRRWVLTENIQILYSWIVDLGEGKYAVDRPTYSERLYTKDSNI